MKGGTGKTSMTFNLAGCIARTAKVLVIDFDSQCNLSSNFNFDIFTEDPTVKTVADIFDDFNTDPWDIVVPSPIPQLPDLDLFPSTMYLYGTELNLSTRSMREQIMQNYMKRNSTFFEQYDYVIFDTGPNMGLINQNAFFVSDHIVLVTDPDCNSAKGAHVFLTLWNTAREFSGLDNNVHALIVNNAERIKIVGELNEYIMQHPYLSTIYIDSPVIHTTRFKECSAQNVPIYFLKTENKQQEESRLKAEASIDNLMQHLIERGIF